MNSFQNLLIPQGQAHQLSFRNTALNQRQNFVEEEFIYNQQRFKRQNESGRGMRCFFNAVGLDAPTQITEMLSPNRINDPINRFMIANEIVNAFRDNIRAIPAQILDALDGDQAFRQETTTLDRLDQARGEALARQNPDANLTNPSLIPQQYQNIQQRREDLLRRVRERAQTLNVYESFIRHHIGGNQMMVSLIDMVNGGNGNFSSVDVIARINTIGIRIFTRDGNGQIQLSHSYIPQNATEIASVYHEGIHFEALLPINDAIIKTIQPVHVEEKMEKVEKKTEQKITPERTTESEEKLIISTFKQKS